MFYLNMTVPNNRTVLGRWVLKDLWKSTLANWLELYPKDRCPWLRYVPDGDKPEEVHFPNGSIMYLVPLADRDKWPGTNIGAFGIDQLEQCQRVTLTDLIRRLRLNGIPRDMYFGLCTANYEKNWAIFREIFKYKRGIDNEALPDGTTTHDQIQLFEPEPGENVANLRGGYYTENKAWLSGNKFERARLIEGIDLETVGMAFPEWDERIHVKDFELAELEEKEPLRYGVGYDYGMKNLTAVTFAARGLERTYLAGEVCLPMTDVAKVEEACERYAATIGFPVERVATFEADKQIFNTQHKGSIAADWSGRWPWQKANQHRMLGRERIKQLLTTNGEDGTPLLWVHSRCEEWRAEIPQLIFADGSEGEERWIKGTRADCYDSGRYNILGLEKPVKPRPIRNSHLTYANYRAIAKKARRGVGYTMPTESVPWLAPRTRRDSD